MENLRFVYNVKNNEEIAKHMIAMNSTFNFDQVYSDINQHHSSSTIITPDKHMNIAFDYLTSPGGHAGITDLMLSYIYPNYHKSKLYGDENVYFDNLDKNVFILTMKSFLIIFMPPQINEYQYNQIVTYINSLKTTAYAKSGNISSVFINDDEFPFDEIDDRIEKLKSYIMPLTIPDEYPFDEITDDEDIDEFIATYYHRKVR